MGSLPLSSCAIALPPEPLQSVAEVRALSSNRLEEGYRVALNGTVTVLDPALQILTIEDSSGGLLVALPARMNGVSEGDQVSVNGFTGYEGFSPVIVHATLARSGPRRPPPVSDGAPQDVVRGLWDYRLVSTECEITRLVGSQTGHYTLEGRLSGRMVRITGSGSQTFGAHQLVGERVRVAGVPITSYDPTGRPYALRIYTGSTRHLVALPDETRRSAQEEAQAPQPPSEGLRELTRVEDVKLLDAAEANRGYRVHLRGIVTNQVTNHASFFLQDQTAAVYALPEAGSTSSVERGDVVEVRGITRQGGFAPVVLVRNVAVRGHAALPEPKRLSGPIVLSSRIENAWVELDGVVLSAREEGDDATEIRLRSGGSTLIVTAQFAMTPEERSALASTVIRVRGNVSPLFASDGHLTGVRVLTPSRRDLTIVGSLEGDSFESPARPIRTLDGYRPDGNRPTRVKVEGHVVHASFKGTVYLMDATGGIALGGIRPGALQVGDVVSVLGLLESQGPQSRLVSVKVRPSARRSDSPGPRAVPPDDARAGLFDGDLVQIDGFLRGRRLTHGDRVFEIDAGRTTFTAVLEEPRSFPRWHRLRTGALLRLTGVAVVDWSTATVPSTPTALRLLLRSPDDIVVLREAPWWTLQRALVVAASLLGVLLLAVTWVWTLRRRVQAQTALIEGQMQRREALEEALRQSQRLESLGRLAGGIAHDFNNILVAINSYGQMLARELQEQERPRRWVEQLRKAGDRATDLTRQLLAVSRRQHLRPVVVDLNALVADLEEMLGRLIGENIALVSALSPMSLFVKVDPGQVSQVVMNLCVNARDAMPEGGRLSLATGRTTLDATYAETHPGVAAGEYACLTVADTGIGMDDATRAQIFEPFFTTRKGRGGTGLGLATALGIVQQSGGHIDVHSTPGQGTVFRVYLPRVAEGPSEMKEPVSEPQGPESAHRGDETVLVVEDDEVVRRLVLDTLAGLGYTVLGAETGEEALVVARRTPERIHLLLADVMLPGMNGRKLADRLMAQGPGMRALFMSGYAHETIARRGMVEADADFLPKPFTPADLAIAVRRVLDREREARPV